MKIIRDGIEIELTSQEVEQAYRERDRYYNGEDVKGHWETMYDGECPYDNETAMDIGERAMDIMCNNDGYWDYYWANFEAAIKEFEEGNQNG